MFDMVWYCVVGQGRIGFITILFGCTPFVETVFKGLDPDQCVKRRTGTAIVQYGAA